jgi:NAD+ synthase (glutamine-hydrolysing)
VELLTLPQIVREGTVSRRPTVPIGPCIVECDDGTAIACESCEELWTPDAPHVTYALAGVDIIANASASHHALRKLKDRERLLTNATEKAGGAYLYANQVGCDGGRLYYDGSALIALNGAVLAQGHQFMLRAEVEVVTATIDLDDIVTYRLGVASRAVQASNLSVSSHSPLLHRVLLPAGFTVCAPHAEASQTEITSPLPVVRHWQPEEEIAKGPACWLWDYLRRSGMNGFFLPLSGGADSSSTAAIVGSMCTLLVRALQNSENGENSTRLISEIRRVCNAEDDYVPDDPRELAGRLLHTAYMGSGISSSDGTKARAAALARDIGGWHCACDIGVIVDAIISVFITVFGESRRPQFRAHGGSNPENLALQNIQARTRMVLAYLFAQLTLWARGKAGSLLVLGSANVDEGLRGYLTKYDCSSADINPIGGISKSDLRSFMRWAAQPEPKGLGYTSLLSIEQAPPTAELEPITSSYSQTDEEDMGMTYDELSWYGRLRKVHRCGPLSMFRKLVRVWPDMAPGKLAEKVKFFFRMYAINRHKMTTLTPSYHAENYSPEDNRFDLRQFLYNVRWPWQFRAIDNEAHTLSARDTSFIPGGVKNRGNSQIDSV